LFVEQAVNILQAVNTAVNILQFASTQACGYSCFSASSLRARKRADTAASLQACGYSCFSASSTDDVSPAKFRLRTQGRKSRCRRGLSACPDHVHPDQSSSAYRPPAPPFGTAEMLRYLSLLLTRYDDVSLSIQEQKTLWQPCSKHSIKCGTLLIPYTIQQDAELPSFANSKRVETTCRQTVYARASYEARAVSHIRLTHCCTASAALTNDMRN
jgi:hypothetical protein